MGLLDMDMAFYFLWRDTTYEMRDAHIIHIYILTWICIICRHHPHTYYLLYIYVFLLVLGSLDHSLVCWKGGACWLLALPWTAFSQRMAVSSLSPPLGRTLTTSLQRICLCKPRLGVWRSSKLMRFMGFTVKSWRVREWVRERESLLYTVTRLLLSWTKKGSRHSAL